MKNGAGKLDCLQVRACDLKMLKLKCVKNDFVAWGSGDKLYVSGVYLSTEDWIHGLLSLC